MTEKPIELTDRQKRDMEELVIIEDGILARLSIKCPECDIKSIFYMKDHGTVECENCGKTLLTTFRP